MNAYLTSVIENVKKKHGNEPEFVQTVEEVFSSLEPVIEKHPEYEKVDLLNRMVEPERILLLKMADLEDALREEACLNSFISGYRLAQGIQQELLADPVAVQL